MTTSDTPDQEPADPDTFIAHHPPERRATIDRLRLRVLPPKPKKGAAA